MYGSLAMLAMSFLISVFSLISMSFMQCCGVKMTYFISQLFATLSMFALFAVTPMSSKFIWLMFVCYVIMGFSFTMFNSVPFAIVNESTYNTENSYFAGVMNCFCLLGQSLSQITCSIININIHDGE